MILFVAKITHNQHDSYRISDDSTLAADLVGKALGAGAQVTVKPVEIDPQDDGLGKYLFDGLNIPVADVDPGQSDE